MAKTGGFKFMIEVRKLTKYFGTKKAVDEISFTVEKGEILGFLGPNAAGKSTTMRMITGFIPPSAGTAVIGGSDIITDSLSARQKIGYLPENAPAYPDMTVYSFLDFCAQIRGYAGTGRKRKIEETIDRCFLTTVRYQAINTLSKGYKQRVCFAQSIIHDPEYLILDEPTDGLDPNQKHEVRLMIQNMASEKAIILSTHILDEMDAVCTRAIIIADGHIVADETPDDLRKKSSFHGAVTLAIACGDPQKLILFLPKVPGIRSVELLPSNDGKTKVRVFPENKEQSIVERLLEALIKKKYTIQSILIEQGRLDEVFRMITTQSAIEQDIPLKKARLSERLRALPELRSKQPTKSEEI
jgi:ABC-2 type transport system ATP-binding protein